MIVKPSRSQWAQIYSNCPATGMFRDDSINSSLVSRQKHAWSQIIHSQRLKYLSKRHVKFASFSLSDLALRGLLTYPDT